MEDQKAAIQQQIQQEQEAYQKEKDQLDAYWDDRMSQDKINAEADRLIVKEGYDKAYLDALAFVTDMNALIDSMKSPIIAAGGALSSGLGQLNAGNNTPAVQEAVQKQMAKNSAEWHNATPERKKELEADNQRLGKSIGGTYDDSTGT